MHPALNLQDLDLNLLIVFNQLLVDRRVSTAADNLGLTQPAVSNALKRLRVSLQDELFVRTYYGMEPTSYAQQLAKPVACALNTLQTALVRQDIFDPSRESRTFTLAMTDIGETYFIPRLMEAFSQLAPNCRVSTVRNTTVSLVESLQNGKIDLAIGLLPDLKAGFFTRRLFQQRYVCLCRQKHPLTEAPLTLESICKYGYVRVVAPSTGHGEVDIQMKRLSLERKILLEVPHFVAVGNILQKTDLLAIVPERFADSCITPFNLTSSPLPFELPEIDISIFWHAKYHRDSSNQWLRQLVCELFSD
ncbi:UNVERIFIED_CONTAM: nahR [Trichonephila clavipes]